MTPLMQSKILRVLQEQRFERVGGRETIETDVRIIAATNRDLEQMVADNRFRSDLYYRLNAFSIRVPPLRDRNTDIVLLLEHFLACFSHELGKNVSDISSEALELLIRYSWPGNVRELQSVLKQAILQATGPVVLPDFLPARLRGRAPLPTATPPRVETPPSETGLDAFVEERLRTGANDLYAQTLAFMERLLLTRVLRHTGGNQSRAAKMLGITRGSLRNKIHLLHITINQAVSVEPEQQSAPSSYAFSP
jgi:two-component system nitrogen regulation response regulator GlnG